MRLATQKAQIRTVHPFPARMAPSIVWDVLPNDGKPLRILDPMSGSGTTVVCARSRGHIAIGCDTDPLALIIARAWSTDSEPEAVNHRAEVVLSRAKTLHEKLFNEVAYPTGADIETRQFIDFWFDPECRRQLSALATCISRVRSETEKIILQCAFSRMIITKTRGVSLAMDVSHSRPHRAYKVAPVLPFEAFLRAASVVTKNNPFTGAAVESPPADIRCGDARSLPVESASVDMIVTSPPYLNAIDYLRGHKLTLVWLGHKVSELRSLRSGNIGTEVSMGSSSEAAVQEAMRAMTDLDSLGHRQKGMVRRYVSDMRAVISECARVTKNNGRVVFVVGDSAIRGVFVRNSVALTSLAESHGLALVSQSTRPIETGRRYLPPPESNRSGGKMQGRMREEVILQFCRAG